MFFVKYVQVFFDRTLKNDKIKHFLKMKLVHSTKEILNVYD